MKVNVKKDECYSECGNHIKIKAGIHDLPDFVAGAWLDQGRAELPTAKKKSPVVEDKAINPVAENKSVKAAPKKKIKKASK